MPTNTFEGGFSPGDIAEHELEHDEPHRHVQLDEPEEKKYENERQKPPPAPAEFVRKHERE